MCLSSGETIVFLRHLVLVILCGWLSGMQGTPCIPESSIEYDGPFILGYTLHTRQSSIQSNKYQVSHKYSCFSRWWAYSRQKHVEKRNKHTKKNRAPSWHYLQDHTRTQGQRNIKLMTSFTDFTHSRGIFSRLNEKCGICGTLKVNIHKISVQTLYEHKLYK